MKSESFLSKAISSWGNLIIYFTLISGTILLLLLFLYLLAPSISDRLFSNVKNIQIKGNSVTFYLRGKTLNIIDVPAYQFGVPSGVTLDKKSTISITAAGLIATDASTKRDDLIIQDDLKNEKDIISNRVLKLETAKESFLGWRRPDGESVYYDIHLNDKPSCEQRASDNMKLADVEYGYLLAFTMRSKSPDTSDRIFDDKISKKLADRKVEMLLIGKGSSIKYNGKNFVVENNNPEIDDQTLSASAGDEIFFIINDTIVRNSKEIDAIIQCKGENSASLQYQKQMYGDKRMNIPQGLWYLDNKGSLRVMVEKESI